jgi:tagatose-1,6-bisphosphate aldolase
VNSWVTLTLGIVGGHTKDAKNMNGSYQVKVLKFKVPVQRSVSTVKVQHIYMWRQLDLNLEVPYVVMNAACNCKLLCHQNFFNIR